MSHPDFKALAEQALNIRDVAQVLYDVRSEAVVLAARIGWPDAPVAGNDLDRFKQLLRVDTNMTAELSKAALAAQEAVQS